VDEIGGGMGKVGRWSVHGFNFQRYKFRHVHRAWNKFLRFGLWWML
jgi:hypothetical protein